MARPACVAPAVCGATALTSPRHLLSQSCAGTAAFRSWWASLWCRSAASRRTRATFTHAASHVAFAASCWWTYVATPTLAGCASLPSVGLAFIYFSSSTSFRCACGWICARPRAQQPSPRARSKRVRCPPFLCVQEERGQKGAEKKLFCGRHWADNRRPRCLACDETIHQVQGHGAGALCMAFFLMQGLFPPLSSW